MIRFLNKDLVIEIHDDQIRSYGGQPGILSESLLDSAIHQPQLAMRFLSPSLYDLAAIYGYHICKNHAFNDGNKRTASASMMVFLESNKLRIIASDYEIKSKILEIESNRINKLQLAAWLSLNTRKFSS